MSFTSSTLVAHNPNFDAKLVSLDQLRALPEPVALGRMHKPIAHARLVDGILSEIERREYVPTKTQFALGAKGSALFGVIDLAPRAALVRNPGVGPALVPATDQQRGISFGFRTSTNKALAIKAVAGQRVFVCDNLALSGDMIAFKHKSTKGLDLGNLIAGGFDRFVQHSTALEISVSRLEATQITDGRAKQVIFDIFNASIVPLRLFDDVSRFYFKPADDMTDCQPRSMWGLHNAFTRAMRDLSPVRTFGATVALGKAFGMTANDDSDVIDAEVIE